MSCLMTSTLAHLFYHSERICKFICLSLCKSLPSLGSSCYSNCLWCETHFPLPHPLYINGLRMLGCFASWLMCLRFYLVLGIKHSKSLIRTRFARSTHCGLILYSFKARNLTCPRTSPFEFKRIRRCCMNFVLYKCFYSVLFYMGIVQQIPRLLYYFECDKNPHTECIFFTVIILHI